jgi:hypothetical protein
MRKEIESLALREWTKKEFPEIYTSKEGDCLIVQCAIGIVHKYIEYLKQGQ